MSRGDALDSIMRGRRSGNVAAVDEAHDLGGPGALVFAIGQVARGDTLCPRSMPGITATRDCTGVSRCGALRADMRFSRALCAWCWDSMTHIFW